MIFQKNIIIGYVITIFSILIFFKIYKTGIFVEQIQYTECIVNCIDIISSIIIFYNIQRQYKSFILLPLSMIFLLLMDIAYLTTFYFKINYNFLIYFMGNIVWYAITILGLILLLLKFVYGKKESYLLFASFLLVALVIIFFFAPNFIKYLYNPYYSEDLSAHIIIFYLCVLLIIATQNRYALLMISGICIIEIGNLAMTECYLENITNKLVYGEFCFLMGLVTSSVGMLNIIRLKLYNPDTWFFGSKTIRNRLSFLFFLISIWSFIIACIVMKHFGTVRDSSLVFIPAIGMFYSMFTALVAVILSKQMEKPFIQIQTKIKSLFDGNNDKSDTINTSLIEFQQLNNFIVESYEYKTTLEKHIVSTATRIAHDIKSPLQIIENLIKNNENNALQDQFIKQINKISYISKSLLKENKKVIDDNSYGLQSIYCIIEDLISDKQIEWNTEHSVINFKYNTDQIIWLDNEQAKIKNIISNLLNNAFEASQANSERINIIISGSQNVTIFIQDFGTGMSDETLNMAKNGKTSKVDGNGIGIPTAEKFMKAIHGTFDIKSKFNYGTTIQLEFPQLMFPQQFGTIIELYTNSIVIVDDNSNIIHFWQEYFLFKRIRKNIEYFINFRSLANYLSENNHNEVTYLLDYHVFGEKITGVDIIKKFNLKNVYLITNYAEDIKLQDEIKLLEVKLIPKTMLYTLLQNNAIKN